MIKIDSPETLLANGLKDTWYAICPSSFITDKPVSLRRLGMKLVFWRDQAGKLYALEDHCPHRGAPLSRGILLGDRIACGYHGVQVRADGVVTNVPGSPGCSLEGKRAARSFHVVERNGAVFLYNSAENVDEAPDFTLPEELVSDEYAAFLCYTEWRGDYRYVIDNVMDPMHGTYLHKQSHSMAEGSSVADFGVRDTEHGFVFEKKGQRGVNFDWTEWANTGLHWLRLEIPYPSTGGPGGSFAIVGTYTPISENLAAVFHWRCRKVSAGSAMPGSSCTATGWKPATGPCWSRTAKCSRSWNPTPTSAKTCTSTISDWSACAATCATWRPSSSRS